MPRPLTSAERILVAQLAGTARNRIEAKTDRAQAIADLRALTTRVDLLSHAAGGELGSWQRGHPEGPGREIALLLIDAGADVDQVKAHAADTVHHLSRATRGGGIGESRG